MKMIGLNALCITEITMVVLFAQGSLDPSAPPAPSMKTLQEVWNKIDATHAATD